MIDFKIKTGMITTSGIKGNSYFLISQQITKYNIKNSAMTIPNAIQLPHIKKVKKMYVFYALNRSHIYMHDNNLIIVQII